MKIKLFFDFICQSNKTQLSFFNARYDEIKDDRTNGLCTDEQHRQFSSCIFYVFVWQIYLLPNE